MQKSNNNINIKSQFIAQNDRQMWIWTCWYRRWEKEGKPKYTYIYIIFDDKALLWLFSFERLRKWKKKNKLDWRHLWVWYRAELQRRFLIHDFVATFGVNNRQIYMALGSYLVWGGPLDTGSRPSVVDDWYRFPTCNKR